MQSIPVGSCFALSAINRFTATACKVSGLKSAHTCRQTVNVLVLCQTKLNLIMCVLTEIFSDAKARTKKGIRISNFAFVSFVFKGHGMKGTWGGCGLRV